MSRLLSVALNLSKGNLGSQAVEALAHLRTACSMLPVLLLTLVFMPSAAHARMPMSNEGVDVAEAGERSCRVSSNASSSKGEEQPEPGSSHQAPLGSSAHRTGSQRSYEQQQQQQQQQAWWRGSSLGTNDPSISASNAVQAALDAASIPSTPDTAPHLHRSHLALPPQNPAHTMPSASVSPTSQQPSQHAHTAHSCGSSPSPSCYPCAPTIAATTTNARPSLARTTFQMNSPVADSSAIKVNSPVVDSSARNAIEANSPLAAPAHNPLATAADAGSVSTPLPGGHDSGTISGATLSPDQGPTPQLQPAPPPPPPDGTLLLAQADLAVNRLFQSAQPSVVNVSGARMATAFSTLDVTRPAPGQGSGFLWDGRGHVVTSYSLVRGAAEVKVTLVDASSYTARVVGWDAGKDVAVLRLSMPKSKLKELRPARLPPTGTAPAAAPTEGLMVGQTVFGIGNVTGLDHTLTKGCVSGLGRELPGSSSSPTGLPLKGLIQVDAPCCHQSGGALFNAQGQVVGMVAPCLGSATSRASGCGLGYAVPIDAFRGLVDQIIAAPVSIGSSGSLGGMGTAKPSRPTLGVTLAPPQVLAALGQEGVLVLEVPPGSPGIAAGLRHTHRDIFGDVILGDVIVGLDGKSVRSSADLFNALDSRRAGDRVRLDILRDGRATSLTVVLGERGMAGMLEE